MASRYPSGPEDSRTYPSAYAYTNYHSKCNYAARSSAASRPPARSPRSPPPAAATQRPGRYYSPKTYTNSSHAADSPAPSTNYFNQTNRYDSPRHQHQSTHRGAHKSPRGRQQAPRSSEYRYNSPRSHDRPTQGYRDQTRTRPTQTQYEPRTTSQYKNTHRTASNADSRGKRDSVATRSTANKPYTAVSSAPILAKKEENTPTKVSAVKEQCSICLNDVKDKVSLKCDHSFCYECLVKWCATKETCPLCRSKVTELKERNKSLPNQRMIATFVCSCGNKWRSSFAYNGIKQGCKKCGSDVAASDMYPKNVISSPVPSTLLGLFSSMRENGSHRQELCGMCRLLGRNCSRQETLGDDEDLLDMVGLENLMALFSLSDSPFDPGHNEDTWSFTLSDTEDYDIVVDWDVYEPIYCADFDEDYSPFEDYDGDWDPGCENV